MTDSASATPTLTLIRHGQTDWNLWRKLQGRTDIPLNDTGREQARAVGAELAASGRTWGALVASPLARARETAQLIGRPLGLEVVRTYPELVERSFGDIEGYDCSAMSEEERHAFMEEHGEPEASVIERGVTVLRRIAEDFPGQDVLVVSHGTFIRLTASHLLGRTLTSLPNGAVVDVPVAAVASR